MKRLGVGQLILLAALIVILIVTAVWAISVWNATGDAVMSTHGWIALGLGTFFSLLIGCGLDPSAYDPTARMMLWPDAFRTMTEAVMAAAADVCLWLVPLLLLCGLGAEGA